MESRASANPIFCMRMKRRGLVARLMIISNRATSNCRCSRCCQADAPRSIEFPCPVAISTAFRATEPWCLLQRRDLGEIRNAKWNPPAKCQNAGRLPMRQSLFFRPNGELAAARLTEVKTASAGEFKNLAYDLAAEFLHLGQHPLQFGMIKDH